MRRNDLVSKALGLAIAGILAGSGLVSAQSNTDKPKAPTAKPSGDDKHACGGPNGCGGATKSSTGKSARGDKHVCKGLNTCKGKGGCQGGDHACAGKNSCKGKGGCEVPVHHKAA